MPLSSSARARFHHHHFENRSSRLVACTLRLWMLTTQQCQPLLRLACSASANAATSSTMPRGRGSDATTLSRCFLNSSHWSSNKIGKNLRKFGVMDELKNRGVTYWHFGRCPIFRPGMASTWKCQKFDLNRVIEFLDVIFRFCQSANK